MGGGLYVVVFSIDICDLIGLFHLESSLFLKSEDCELKTDGSVEIGEGLWFFLLCIHLFWFYHYHILVLPPKLSVGQISWGLLCIFNLKSYHLTINCGYFAWIRVNFITHIVSLCSVILSSNLMYNNWQTDSVMMAPSTYFGNGSPGLPMLYSSGLFPRLISM